METGKCSTIGVSEPPAGGDAGHAPWEVIGGLRQADRGHTGRQPCWGGQFEQSDVVADGQHVELGVLEDLDRQHRSQCPHPQPGRWALGTPQGLTGTMGTERDPGDGWEPHGMALCVPG